MGFMDKISGQEAINEVRVFQNNMEEVYTAFATRMIELMDKQEKLATRQTELQNMNSRLSELETAHHEVSLIVNDLSAGQAEMAASRRKQNAQINELQYIVQQQIPYTSPTKQQSTQWLTAGVVFCALTSIAAFVMSLIM
ncbi:MAG: hypothetical protein JXX14_17730 [Deltaproteobacteria bacterium]|nr:hypothetical protein [Deltaproteobacteria bacterium]